jgi:hypothetical protein
MANEKVTQMVELPAGEIAANDLFLLVDTSAKESKKLQASSFVDYIVNSASFNSVSASFTDSSSYVNPAGVGLIASASYAIRSTTASYAHITPSAETASYALISQTAAGTIVNAETASFLKYTTNVDNGTASYALSASFVKLSNTASFILYTGDNTGTASYALSAKSSSYSRNADSSSWSIYAKTASYLLDVGLSVESASHALRSNTASYLEATASHANIAITSSFIGYVPGVNSGTSSYTMNAEQAITSSYVSSDAPNVIKAWATLYWMAGKANTTIYKSYNIASVDYLDDGAAHPGETIFTRWKVLFENDLPSTNYTLIGTVQKYYGSTGAAQRGDVLIWPEDISQPKYVNGFTMSMKIPSDDYGTWFTANKNVTSPTWEGYNTGSCHFMIVGG